MSYITNTTTFHRPLSPEEEDKYLKLYKSGNEDARNILIERNLRLVAHIVKNLAIQVKKLMILYQLEQLV